MTLLVALMTLLMWFTVKRSIRIQWDLTGTFMGMHEIHLDLIGVDWDFTGMFM
jgi:hypothetical protein